MRFKNVFFARFDFIIAVLTRYIWFIQRSSQAYHKASIEAERVNVLVNTLVGGLLYHENAGIEIWKKWWFDEK